MTSLRCAYQYACLYMDTKFSAHSHEYFLLHLAYWKRYYCVHRSILCAIFSIKRHVYDWQLVNGMPSLDATRLIPLIEDLPHARTRSAASGSATARSSRTHWRLVLGMYNSSSLYLAQLTNSFPNLPSPNEAQSTTVFAHDMILVLFSSEFLDT